MIKSMPLFFLTALAVTILYLSASTAIAQIQSPIERGKYLSHVMVCVECHTPGVLSGGKQGPELAGSEVGYEIPGLGIFHGANLTPDMDTGIGSWSEENIITAIRTGERPDGRILAAAMPWRAFASLSDSDAKALAAYLRSLEPVVNKVPGPFGPSETHPGLYYRFMFPGRDQTKTE